MLGAQLTLLGLINVCEEKELAWLNTLKEKKYRNNKQFVYLILIQRFIHLK